MDNITMFNNSTQTNITTEQDFFKDLYSDSGLKQVTLGIFYTGVLFGWILDFGIIWYERVGGNQRYRTAINQLFSTVSWIVVSFIIFVYIPEGVRFLVGPLDPIRGRALYHRTLRLLSTFSPTGAGIRRSALRTPTSPLRYATGLPYPVPAGMHELL